MNKLILLLLFIPLVSCTNDEETRIFTVTTEANPPEGGKATLETGELTTGEYLWGDDAFVTAKPSDGYVFTHWTANTYITGQVNNGNPGSANNKSYTSLELRCYDEDKCIYDIIMTANFDKKNQLSI